MDEFEHGPDQGERGGLAGDAADHLRPSPDLDEGALEYVRAPDPFAVLVREAQMDDERVEVVVERAGEGGVGGGEVGGERGPSSWLVKLTVVGAAPDDSLDTARGSAEDAAEQRIQKRTEDDQRDRAYRAE